MPTQTQELVSNLLDQDGALVVAKPIYSLTYKEGPVLKYLNFYAANQAEADLEAAKFVKHISSRDNRKVVQVGKAKPFCVTIDEEIARWEKKNAPPPQDQY